jgi:hypothetical protein
MVKNLKDYSVAEMQIYVFLCNAIIGVVNLGVKKPKRVGDLELEQINPKDSINKFSVSNGKVSLILDEIIKRIKDKPEALVSIKLDFQKLNAWKYLQIGDIVSYLLENLEDEIIPALYKQEKLTAIGLIKSVN